VRDSEELELELELLELDSDLELEELLDLVVLDSEECDSDLEV